MKTCTVGTHLKHYGEVLLMITHNVCFACLEVLQNSQPSGVMLSAVRRKFIVYSCKVTPLPYVENYRFKLLYFNTDLDKSGYQVIFFLIFPQKKDNILSWRYNHEISSAVILSHWLIQEGQLSVSGDRMCTILVNHTEDYAYPVKVGLGKLTMLDMTG